ncbi:MAG TPA: hypothetical protein VN493_12870 [Thermoanaerobaculia bacterium]|nr:hypothetical protein [Thermoanaerobaculia bacterium]
MQAARSGAAHVPSPLVELLAERTPATVKLQADPAKPPAEVSIADQILQILAAVDGQVVTFELGPSPNDRPNCGLPV